ncbi:MAG: hypothetical protein JSR57_06360 [Verrucomicrobia bacterium]|nr:hypothetical protein [Verrucomicrobiota bacterium]
MSSAILPVRYGLTDGKTCVPIPLSENWKSEKVDSMFHRLGELSCVEDQIVVRAFNLSDQKEIEALATSFPPSKETFTIVKHSQCYVNRLIQDYYVLKCSVSVFSSERLKLLRDRIDQRFFFPAAIKNEALSFFAPDMMHVEFTHEMTESVIQNWAEQLGMVYYPHRHSAALYKSAVVHLSSAHSLVSAFEGVHSLPEIASVRLHELPDPEYPLYTASTSKSLFPLAFGIHGDGPCAKAL